MPRFAGPESSGRGSFPYCINDLAIYVTFDVTLERGAFVTLVAAPALSKWQWQGDKVDEGHNPPFAPIQGDSRDTAIQPLLASPLPPSRALR